MCNKFRRAFGSSRGDAHFCSMERGLSHLTETPYCLVFCSFKEGPLSKEEQWKQELARELDSVRIRGEHMAALLHFSSMYVTICDVCCFQIQQRSFGATLKRLAGWIGKRKLFLCKQYHCNLLFWYFEALFIWRSRSGEELFLCGSSSHARSNSLKMKQQAFKALV